MRLANLLPKVLRRSTKSGDDPNERRSFNYWYRVRDWWWPNDEDAIHNMFYLKHIVDEFPLELQAFILNDDAGRHIEISDETSSRTEPLFDPSHLQPLENITLIGQSERKLQAIVSKSKERIDVETKNSEPKTSLPHNLGQADLALGSVDEWLFGAYYIGNIKFKKVGLSYLADRARKRLFFIFAADEILDAMVGQNTNQKLNNTWHSKVSGAVRGYLYVENDEVKSHPPILFSFVVGVQPSRIRRCGICESYFWAGRKDKKVCSEQCGATSRKREQRIRDYEKKIGTRRRKRKNRK
ncbi:MAG: hypothetical protein H0W99_09260 [Acidobacteria bacterium]|nr:hypothetical protein [Acidobacteriota bacterium]